MTAPSETPANSSKPGLVLRYSKAILFIVIALCFAGVYAGFTMPSSVFPETNFPRVVILIDNGVIPGDEMMATVTRPVEEAMKNIPGTTNIRSTTGRGSAAVNVFFDWKTDMSEAEQYVLGRLAQIRNTLPPAAAIQVHRMTFSAFPILGISLTSQTRPKTDIWETARYDIYPRFLRIPGVARINLVGGRVPEFHVIVDPSKLDANNLTLGQVSTALAGTNQFTSAGMHEENYQLYLSVVDNRLHDPNEIEDVVIAWVNQAPIRIRDVATVQRGAAPQFNRISANGKDAVLLNIYGQPNCNTVQIADDLDEALLRLKKELPPDMQLGFFYDQSQFVREGVGSVWEAIILGLILSVIILYLFLRSLASTIVAAMVIPVTVILTLIGLRLLGMSFNLMTLGGIAAVIGIVIDDAIVVVESIYAKVLAGCPSTEAVALAMREVGPALVGSTMTPVVVFIPLAFLDGVAGVFFRALAVTMVVALLISLALAVTWTPVTAGLLIRRRKGQEQGQHELEQGGPILRRLIDLYAAVMNALLRVPVVATIGMALVATGGFWMYSQLDSDFLPAQEEGAFIIDYYSRPGTSLSETDRMLQHIEEILNDTPEVEGFSRRTGARLALAIAEPNTGDFLVKLNRQRDRSTEEVIEEVRAKCNEAEPALSFEFPGVLGDLIGDLTWSPKPVEIKIFSTDTKLLKEKAEEIAQTIEQIPGVVDVEDGLVVAGPSMRLKTDLAVAARIGMTPQMLGSEIQSTLLGTISSYVLQGDRTYNVRVMSAPESHQRERSLGTLPIHTATGAKLTVRDVAQIEHEPGLLEMHREDLRQLVAVSARFEGIDLGHGIATIKDELAKNVTIPPEMTIEFGGLFQQQQESFRNLSFVLIAALVLVYVVLMLEFRTFLAPLAIWMGALLALVGVVGGLWVTGTTLNIVSILGAIIAMGIVHKNGILMFDYVENLRAQGLPIKEAMVQSGRRRLRPVLMTSLTTFLGLLPLAYGIGAGADMLRPMAIAVIGSLCMSLLLSLVATPVFYYMLVQIFRLDQSSTPPDSDSAGAEPNL